MKKLKNLLLLIIFAVITLTGCVNVYDKSLKLDPVNSGEPDTPDTYLDSINNTLWITEDYETISVRVTDKNGELCDRDAYKREAIYFTQLDMDMEPKNILAKITYMKLVDGNSDFVLEEYIAVNGDCFIYEYDNFTGNITLLSSSELPSSQNNYWVQYKGELSLNGTTINMIYVESPEQIDGGISFPDITYKLYEN